MKIEDSQVLPKTITRVRGTTREKVEDPVAVEAPVTIYLNGRELVTLLCTPEKIDRLALGFLRSEGLLENIADVAALRVREDEGLVEVDLAGPTDLGEKLFGKRTITSGCGKGTIFFNVLDSLRSAPLEGSLKIEAARVRDLVRLLHDRAELFKATGGVHSAALADGEDILYFCEDIGRHNAVDKIVGECLMDSVDPGDKILVLSGRLTSEILLKAAKLKIQLLLSRAAPTSLSIELADHLNITLAGFIRGGRFNIYSHDWRIMD